MIKIMMPSNKYAIIIDVKIGNNILPKRNIIIIELNKVTTNTKSSLLFLYVCLYNVFIDSFNY